MSIDATNKFEKAIKEWTISCEIFQETLLSKSEKHKKSLKSLSDSGRIIISSFCDQNNMKASDRESETASNLSRESIKYILEEEAHEVEIGLKEITNRYGIEFAKDKIIEITTEFENTKSIINIEINSIERINIIAEKNSIKNSILKLRSIGEKIEILKSTYLSDDIILKDKENARKITTYIGYIMAIAAVAVHIYTIG